MTPSPSPSPSPSKIPNSLSLSRIMFTMSDHEMLQYQTRPPPPPPPSSLVMMERSWKPNVEIAPNCPRCASSNTKFCYYNNYSFSQPRYFCKGCRRYWTKGGSLRNIPVGGGCRKARRSGKSSLKSPSSSSSSLTDSLITDHNPIDPPAGSDIDIAAVFANFLNHNNNSSTTEEDHHVMMMDGQQQPSDHSTQEFDGQDYQDMDVFGVQDLTGGGGGGDHDQVVEDALWSDVTGLWQPLDQFQEFDQMVVASSTNLINHDGGWTSSSSSSSFDLPSYELFSRP